MLAFHDVERQTDNLVPVITYVIDRINSHSFTRLYFLTLEVNLKQ